jgi:hypothetical protein
VLKLAAVAECCVGLGLIEHVQRPWLLH